MSAPSWDWVDLEVAVTAHAEQLAEHGGGDGLRDRGALESAMARPQNLAFYGEPDLAELAASYAFGLARNHPFVDGNKRTAAVVSLMFLRLNGWRIDATQAEMAAAFLELAAGNLAEDKLSAWFRERVRPAA